MQVLHISYLFPSLWVEQADTWLNQTESPPVEWSVVLYVVSGEKEMPQLLGLESPSVEPMSVHAIENLGD